MNNVVTLPTTDRMLRTLEHAAQATDNPGHKPPSGGGTGSPPMEARVAKLEGIAEKTSERLGAIEKDAALIKMDLSSFKSEAFRTFSTKDDVSRLEASMHKEFVAQTWRIIGLMVTFGTVLTAAVFFIARNVK